MSVSNLLNYFSPYVLTFPFVVIIAYIVQRYFKKHPNAPPGPLGLPIVGYMPFLTTRPYKKLYQLTKKYGGVYGLNLGTEYIIVAGDRNSAREALSKQALLDRSPILPIDFLPGGFGFLADNGKVWHEQKSFSLRVLRDLGLGKGPVEQSIRDEVTDLFEIADKYKGKPFDISNELMSSVSNVITTLVYGKRLAHDDPARKYLNEATDTVLKRVTQVGVPSFIPSLKPIYKFLTDPFGRHHASLMNLLNFTRNEIQTHKKEKSESNESWDYISQYLTEIENKKSANENSSFSDERLIGNVQIFFIAGTETTKTTLHWAFVAMAAYQDIQSKVQEEIDNKLGRDKFPNWEDRTSLPYVMAVLQEVQRWRTVVPLGVLRCASEDTTLGGYFVPKNTTVIVLQHGVHRDESCWEDPEKFIPERHLTEHKTKLKKVDGFLPFSSGRRSCPGEGLAVMELFIFFTSFLQRYSITPPAGAQVDVKDYFNNVVQPNAQDLCFNLRK